MKHLDRRLKEQLQAAFGEVPESIKTVVRDKLHAKLMEDAALRSDIVTAFDSIKAPSNTVDSVLQKIERDSQGN